MNKLFFLLFLVPVPVVTAQQIIWEEVQLNNKEIIISGTVSYPDTAEAPPLVVIVNGSGNPDRNGNQEKLGVIPNHMKMLSDSLNTYGIAVYRYDKRNANPDNIPSLLSNGFSFDHLVEDVKIIIEHFAKSGRFKEIILLGHSQGSLVSMLAINENVSRFISLAGASKTFEETLIAQLNAQNEELGRVASLHMKELRETDTIQEVNIFLASIFKPINYKFIKNYNSYDPVEIMHTLTLPVLIVNGDQDLQITPEDAANLHSANPNAKLTIIKGMNHVLKQVKDVNENRASYHSNTFPLSPELIKVLTDYIKE
ncbi:alpha/beta hydrolase [Ascidiimonas aurantiaca]|uniref:alpha/beta hydrolase n=1 Tax=Ascidiimonas aurantiaca TaxID=1685432 RepID=UPI0030EBE829